MKRNGDFLVRETMNNTDQDRYVISSFRNGPVHFKVFPGTIVVSQSCQYFVSKRNVCLWEYLKDP